MDAGMFKFYVNVILNVLRLGAICYLKIVLHIYIYSYVRENADVSCLEINSKTKGKLLNDAKMYLSLLSNITLNHILHEV